MREHLASLVEDFRRYDREVAVVRYKGNRRRVTTYGQIAHLAGRFAALLEEQGIGVGDRVLLWAENSAQWIAAFYGCLLRGIVVVPLDAFGTSDFAARVAADVRPKLAVGDALLLRQLPSDPPLNFPRVPFEYWLDDLPDREAAAVAGLNAKTPFQILFTSGTTGDPKGIVHTHGNVLASVGPVERAAQGYMRYEPLVHPLRFLHTLPMSHVFGQTMGLWVPPIFRAHVHFESRLVAPRLIETIKRERISVLAAVPRVFSLLKTHLELTEPQLSERVQAARKLKAWQKWWVFRDIHREFGLKFWALISGGGALPSHVEQFWNALGFVLVQGYGMTETTALITLNHPFHVAQGTIGKPLPDREIKITPEGEVLVRGPMISTATWSGGQLREREGDWLATGDLAEREETGELKFLGRKSEVIVTGTGVNIHPEDLEAAIEAQPGVAACAVVAIDTPLGPEPCAVLAMRSSADGAAEAVERANAGLAEFQRVRRWALWPEPDLPRTSTGKVRRKPVAAWMANAQASAEGKRAPELDFAPSNDWLLAIIAQITGEKPHGVGDELRLAEDLHLDSLGRVQLAASIEQKLGMSPESGLLEQVQTLGELRAIVGGTESSIGSATPVSQATSRGRRSPAVPRAAQPEPEQSSPVATISSPGLRERNYVYPRWPWLKPVQWIRTAFIEGLMCPLVRFLAAPRVTLPPNLTSQVQQSGSMLIVANHVTTYDGPLVQYALPSYVRQHIAAAMAGDMLDDFRHFRNPERGGRFSLLAPVAYWLITALFNVFPLPRSRDFQRSFMHAGEALDHGFNVLIFPEGTRSAAGKLAPFRAGIGLLVRQSDAPVLPVAIRGLGELKQRGRGWFRSGTIEIRVGEPIRFAPEATENEITESLHNAVADLLTSPPRSGT